MGVTVGILGFFFGKEALKSIFSKLEVSEEEQLQVKLCLSHNCHLDHISTLRRFKNKKS